MPCEVTTATNSHPSAAISLSTLSGASYGLPASCSRKIVLYSRSAMASCLRLKTPTHLALAFDAKCIGHRLGQINACVIGRHHAILRLDPLSILRFGHRPPSIEHIARIVGVPRTDIDDGRLDALSITFDDDGFRPRFIA